MKQLHRIGASSKAPNSRPPMACTPDELDIRLAHETANLKKVRALVRFVSAELAKMQVSVAATQDLADAESDRADGHGCWSWDEARANAVRVEFLADALAALGDLLDRMESASDADEGRGVSSIPLSRTYALSPYA